MAHANMDIDEQPCAVVMRRYGLRTKREALNFALRQLAAELTVEEARQLKGSGWKADLEELRSTRVPAGVFLAESISGQATEPLNELLNPVEQ